MAKKMKKLLALTLALSMSMSMLSFQAFAADGELPDDVTPISSSDILPDGKPDEGAVTNSGDPVESKDPTTGNKVVTATSTVTWGSSSGGTDVDDDDLQSDPNRKPIDTETTEITPNPAKPDEQLTGSNSSTSTSGSETTTKVDKYDDKGRLESETTTITGSETTTQSSTTKKVDKYDDRLVSDSTTKKKYINGELVEVDDKPVEGSNVPDDTEILANKQEGNWEQGGLKQEGQWIPGEAPDDDDWTLQSGDGQLSALQPTQNNGADVPVKIEDVKNGNSITINLTPGQKITEEVKVEVDVNELVAKHLTIDDYIAEQCAAIENAGNEENIVDGSGNVIGKKVTVDGVTTELTYTEQKDEDGNVIGYSVTKTVTTIKETGDIADSQKSGEAQFPTKEETQNIPATAAGLDKVVLPSDVVAGTKDVTDDNGKKIGETVTAIEQVQIDGQWYYKVTKTTTTNVVEDPDRFDSDKETTTQTSGSTFTKPAVKPAEIEPYENPETGNMVTVTVKKINGGWERVYEEKNGDTVVATRSEKFFDTTVTVNATVETDPDYEIYNKSTETVSTEIMYYSATVQQGEAAIDSTKQVGYQKDVVTDTQYQVIEIGGAYYAYTASMTGVTDTSTTVENNDTATALSAIPLSSFKQTEFADWKGNYTLYPNNGNYVSQNSGNDLQGIEYQDGEAKRNSSWFTPFSLNELNMLQNNLKADEYVLIGYGAFSEYELNDDGGTMSGREDPEPHSLKQFAILGKDGISYVYCVQLREGIQLGNGGTMTSAGTSTKVDSDAVYSQLDLKTMMGETFTMPKNVPLKDDKESLMPLNSIVSNGYMGTASGVGSLQAVKELLKNNRDKHTLTDEQIDKISEGQALAATQAAIWKYGNDGQTTFEDLGTYMRHYFSDSKPSGSNVCDTTSEDYKNIEAVYDVLCSLAAAAGGADVPAKVTASDVKGATIVLKDEVEIDKYNTVSEAIKAVKNDEDKVYNTDLSFTLAVSNSTYNGDLVVYVYASKDGGEKQLVETRRIAGNGDVDAVDSAVRGKDGNTTYTIKDIKLAENVDITLKLQGTQYLTGGVYVYSCDNSQNFIGGLNSLTQNVNLEVGLNFNVTEDPSAQLVEKSSHDEDTYKATRTDTKRDIYDAYKYDQHSKGTLHTEKTVTENTKVYADITVTEIVTQETSATVEWSDTNTTYHTYKDELKKEELKKEEIKENKIPTGSKTPTEDLPDENVPLEELPEEDIPLADVPKTGDVSVLWAVMSLISGAGLAGLSLVSKKREDEEA